MIIATKCPKKLSLLSRCHLTALLRHLEHVRYAFLPVKSGGGPTPRTILAGLNSLNFCSFWA